MADQNCFRIIPPVVEPIPFILSIPHCGTSFPEKLKTNYKKEVIEETFKYIYKGCKISYSIESTPLGTGGAIFKALNLIESNDVLILNGDTHFPIDYKKFFHD